MEHGSALFHIGPVEVSSVMVTMLGLTVLLTVVCWLGTRRMKTVPSGLQNLLEKGIEMLDNFIGGLLSPELKQRFFPLLATLFIFILFSNYSGLLPLAGRLPGLASPTASLSVTVALAAMIFVLTHYVGLREHGFGYFKHFLNPHRAKSFVLTIAFFIGNFLLMLLFILEEAVRPVSLSLRLYGNIFGEEAVTEQLFHMVPIAVPVIMNVFSLLMGAIQAMVFVLLACIYIEGAAGEAH